MFITDCKSRIFLIKKPDRPTNDLSGSNYFFSPSRSSEMMSIKLSTSSKSL